jgi:cellulose synthase/poly-beta-1,6-N-acetylglucosamine synthase-like glycosyltransferase
MMSAAIYPVLFISIYFEVFLLLSFLEGKKTRPAPARLADRDLPSVTVFVPCYNEEATVGRTLDSLLALDYPADKLTVFAIDDGSKDGTLAVIEGYAAAHPQVRAFHQENGGKHTALNLGLAHATTDLVGALDADSFVAPDSLREVVRYFADPAVMATTSAIKVWEPRSVIQRIQHAEYAMSAFVRRTFSWMDALFITPGPFSFFRRGVFEALGPYRAAHNTEDMEIALRMQRAGMRIENVPTAHVFTNAPRTYPSLFRQRVRWSYGFLKNASEYRDLFFNPRYGTLGMLILPLGLFTVFPPIFLSAASIAYAAGNAARTYERVSVVGFSVPRLPALDWFYIDTGASLLLIGVVLLLAFGTLLIGRAMIGDRKLDLNLALYMGFYGFLAPWWLARAAWNAAVSNEGRWAEEIDRRRKRG